MGLDRNNVMSCLDEAVSFFKKLVVKISTSKQFTICKGKLWNGVMSPKLPSSVICEALRICKIANPDQHPEYWVIFRQFGKVL